jgi:diphosphomevalonate decarboxylase
MSTYLSSWESPSNIALIKYWGKKSSGVQLPSNASISFTLKNCVSRTSLKYSEQETLEIEVFLDGDKTDSFVPKIQQFLDRISKEFPFLKTGKYKIQTTNSFPHSSGIASSASGLSALALCICDIAIEKGKLKANNLFTKASELARLGSGSASRSIYGPMAVWGSHNNFEGSSDELAVAYSDIHPVFNDFCDTILLVHRGQKTVSSSVGHNLIKGHPFAEARFAQANENMSAMQEVLKSGDLLKFIEIVESEALTLHSLMMSSKPYFVLMKPNTLSIIEKIWDKRQRDGVNWCFTLDAGANVHFLFPKTDEAKALEFVDNELKQFCENGAYICDQVGKGPVKIQNND